LRRTYLKNEYSPYTKGEPPTEQGFNMGSLRDIRDTDDMTPIMTDNELIQQAPEVGEKQLIQELASRESKKKKGTTSCSASVLTMTKPGGTFVAT